MLEKVIENWMSRLDYIRASRGSPMPEIIFKIYFGCQQLSGVDQTYIRSFEGKKQQQQTEKGEIPVHLMADNPHGINYSNLFILITQTRFVQWAQNEIAVVPDFHKRILFSDEAHFWLNGYVNKQNGRIWSEANPHVVYVETPLHPEKLTVWCALWAGGILLQKR
ncbi:hypothetical protein TNCV_33631 [Trichonephila clavipes]|nr:hypothetical protein TNCV_33631 [Trichonephila clavipes]